MRFQDVEKEKRAERLSAHAMPVGAIDTVFYQLRLRRGQQAALNASDFLRPVCFVRSGASLGEACPESSRGETPHMIQRVLGEIVEHLGGLGQHAPQEISGWLRRHYPMVPSARCAIEMLVYDRQARSAGHALHEYLNLENPNGQASCYTMRLSHEAAMMQELAECEAYEYLNVICPTNALEDLKRLRWLAKNTQQRLRLDLCGSLTLEEARQLIGQLGDLKIDFIIQPLGAHKLSQMAELKRWSPLPLMLSDDVPISGGLEHLQNACNGVVVNLMTCGGISEGLRLIGEAKRMGLKVCLRTGIHSSLARTAAAHLAGLVDYACFGGYQKLENDPIDGMKLVDGRIQLPPRPGIGAKIRPSYQDYFPHV